MLITQTCSELYTQTKLKLQRVSTFFDNLTKLGHIHFLFLFFNYILGFYYNKYYDMSQHFFFSVPLL